MKYIIENCPIDWEPAPVRNLIQKAQMEGHHPSRLLLGHCEAGALRRYLGDNFEGAIPNTFTDTYYLGLKVQEEDAEHLLAIDGEKVRVQPQDDLPPLENNLSPRWHDNDPIGEEEVSSELELGIEWDTAAIRNLITTKSAVGRTPAFLFLGHHEAGLLRAHLGAAFGCEAVRSLKNLYYMGLEIIEVDTQNFLRTAGMKRVKAFQDALGRQPKWKDIKSSSAWHFQV
ncbi:hypothetical protein AAFN60_19985 [Roseibacillus persicicus]|uniref:hypothetical protein n=1 Tax=Roseibacillus persicicus TaxID=454148 RepID=UPI00398B7F1F